MHVKPLLALLCTASVVAATGCGSSDDSTSTSAAAASSGSASGSKVSCPNGKLTFGVEPYDSGAKFLGAYKALTSDLSSALGCKVKLVVTENYTAEVEAMRAGKLDIGEFGPLGYIFASQLAKATPIAAFADANGKPSVYYAGIWVPKDSSIKSVGDLKGKTLALADPASTSGSLYPLYALSQAGLSKSDVKITYAGGHPQSMLALTHGKTDASEVNTQQQATATDAGQFKASSYRQIWKSTPIENDPITVRGNLSPDLQAKIKQVILGLSKEQLKLVDKELGVDAGPLVGTSDSAYQGIRDVVKDEHLDLSAINS